MLGKFDREDLFGFFDPRCVDQDDPSVAEHAWIGGVFVLGRTVLGEGVDPVIDQDVQHEFLLELIEGSEVGRDAFAHVVCSLMKRFVRSMMMSLS